MCTQSVGDVLRKELRLCMFGFNGVSPDRFYTALWKLPVPIFAITKCLLSAYSVAMLTWTSIGTAIIQSRNPHISHRPYFEFLTHWQYILLCMYLLYSAIVVVIHSCKRSHSQNRRNPFLTEDNQDITIESHYSLNDSDQITEHTSLTQPIGSHYSLNESDQISEHTSLTQPTSIQVIQPNYSHNRLPYYLKIQWLLGGVCNSIVVFVTIMFFSVLYDHHHPINTNDLQLHGISSVIVSIDYLISAVPVRLFHVIYPVIFATVYTIFTVIYWAADHTNVVYPMLNWNHAGKTSLICFGALILVVLLHWLSFLVYKLKMCLHVRLLEARA